MIESLIPHNRINPLTRESVLVSPQRAERPWNGKVETLASAELPSYDSKCYLCPGNTRANGITNPKYNRTYVFGNDHPALMPPDLEAVLQDPQSENPEVKELFQTEPESGLSRVICYTPEHNKSMAKMSPAEILIIIKTWQREFKEIGADPHIHHVQIFENKGSVMGCSNPHPHGQIWAQSSVPSIPKAEGINQKSYQGTYGQNMLVRYAEEESTRDERTVIENGSFIAVVPYWATWPYETMILPTTPATGIDELSKDQTHDLADVLHRLTKTYDGLFDTSFPYSMGIHQRPTDGDSHPEWQMHVHFYPPLLRSATVKKFMVGYEMLAQAQRDITPEQAANTLKAVYNKTFSSTE